MPTIKHFRLGPENSEITHFTIRLRQQKLLCFLFLFPEKEKKINAIKPAIENIRLGPENLNSRNQGVILVFLKQERKIKAISPNIAKKRLGPNNLRNDQF